MGSLYFNRAAVAQFLGFLSPRHSSTNGNLTAACSGRANKLASHYQSLVRAADAGRSAARYYDYGNYAFRPRDRGIWSGARPVIRVHDVAKDFGVAAHVVRGFVAE